MSIFERTFKARRAWFVALLLAAISLAPGMAIGQETGSEQDSATEATSAVTPVLDERFTQPPGNVTLPQIPSDPVETLVTAVNAHSTSLGSPAGPDQPVDHGPAIRDANLSPEFAGRVALLVQAALDCPALEETDTEVAEEQLNCAAAANDAAVGVSRTQDTSSSGDIQAQETSSSGDVQAWPSLYIDEDGGDDKYVHDYSILIDKGGNDTYDNNAGGNLLDHLRGPEGSAAPFKADAIGCEHPHILPAVPGTVPAPFDCIADRQTVLVDQKGDDTYGVFKPPRKEEDPTNPLPPNLQRKVDGDCTNDPVVRRIMTEGAALQGNALLMDAGGNDKYKGKTGSQGTGHVGGIGVLRDLGGTQDDYLAIRNSQGFSLVSGLGLLQDEGGNDRYHLYMPRPIDPNAPFGEDGYGGVVDDTNQCDRLPRMVQGTGISFGSPGGQGRLLDENGRDVYEGNPPQDQLFTDPDSPTGVFQFRHSSQGFGCDSTVGILEDKGKDEDTYRGGPKNRRDGASILEPNVRCGTFPSGVGVFEDDGPNTSGDCDGKDGKRGKRGKRNGNGAGNGAGNGERDCRR